MWSLTSAGPLAQLFQVAHEVPLVPIKQRIACLVTVSISVTHLSAFAGFQSKSLELLMNNSFGEKKKNDLPDYRL